MTVVYHHLATIDSIEYYFQGDQDKDGMIDLFTTQDKKRMLTISYRQGERGGFKPLLLEEEDVPKVFNISHIENLFEINREAIHSDASRILFGRG